jgi:hypothetical protein
MNTLQEFVETYRSAGYRWKEIDQVLRRMCQESPEHVQVPDVYAKVALINRAYRANVQMGAKDAEWKVAERLVDRRADEFISPLLALSCFNHETIARVVDAHQQLVKIVHSVTGRITDSFASKYLSFHAPDVVPLFDGHSEEVAQRLVGDRVRRESYRGNVNQRYAHHCEAVLLLVDILGEHGIADPKLKQIDCAIYGTR